MSTPDTRPAYTIPIEANATDRLFIAHTTVAIKETVNRLASGDNLQRMYRLGRLHDMLTMWGSGEPFYLAGTNQEDKGDTVQSRGLDLVTEVVPLPFDAANAQESLNIFMTMPVIGEEPNLEKTRLVVATRGMYRKRTTGRNRYTQYPGILYKADGGSATAEFYHGRYISSEVELAINNSPVHTVPSAEQKVIVERFWSLMV